MSLKKLPKEQIQEMSFIEIAYELLVEKKKPVSFQDIRKEITVLLNLSEQEVNEKIAQFYTDLNIDGRFLSLGENNWGLRTWYPVDHVVEEVVPAAKPKKKKAKAKKAKKEELEDFDEVEEEEEEEDLIFEDIDDLEDDDDDDDDLLDDDDLDDDLDEDLDDDLEIEEDDDEDLDDEDDDK